MKTIKRYSCLILLFLFGLISSIQAAQESDTINYFTYHRLINEARYYMYHQDYSQSRIYYDEAFSLGLTPANYDRYDYARVVCEMGDTSTAISILNQLTKTASMLKDSTYFTDISLSTRKKMVEQAEQREKKIRENYTMNEEEKYVQKLAENIFNYRNYRGDTLSAGNDLRKQRIIDSIHAIATEKYRLIGLYILEKGFAAFNLGLNYSRSSDVRYFLFQADSLWYNENKEFLKNQVALGYLSPYALYQYNRYLSAELKDSLTTVEEHFKLANEWGISPYFELESSYYFSNKGFGPVRMPDYYLFEQEKFRFNCTDYNKLD